MIRCAYHPQFKAGWININEDGSISPICMTCYAKIKDKESEVIDSYIAIYSNEQKEVEGTI